MRILFIDTTTDNQEIGGGHLILPDLMKALIKRGHEVHLVVKGEANQKLAPFIDQSGAIVHISPWNKKATVLKLLPRFDKWIRTLNPDAYVISSSAAIGWLILPWLPESLPTYSIGHNDEKTFYEPVKHYNEYLSGAIGVSHRICDMYEQECKMPAENISWIPYGVQIAQEINLESDVNCIKLIYAGRIETNQKRIMDLSKILISLGKNNVNYKCDIIGDGPELASFSESLKEEVENGRVVFHGWLGKSVVLEKLRQADVFLLTSAFEGFSIALTEAMANGCCPVVTNIEAGNQQLIQHAKNGFLIDVGDIEGFVATVSSLAENRIQLEALRLNAWNTGKEYSLDRMAEKYERLFQHDRAKQNSKRANPDHLFEVMPSCRSSYPIWLRQLKALFEKVPSV